MIKKIIFFLYKSFFTNHIYIKIISNRIKVENYNYDFQKIIFEDLSHLRKILFSKEYYSKKIDDNQSLYYHSFDWLIAAKKIGGAKSITIAKKQIFNWHDKKYSKNSFIWNINLTTKRLINLIYNYDYYAVSSTLDEKNNFHKIIIKHYLLVNLYIKLEKIENFSIEATKIILLLKIIYRKKTENTIKIIQLLIDNLVDKNGYHKSNNPSYQAEFINHLHEIKNICLFFDIQVPDQIDYQIHNMSSAFNNMFHKDNSIALFNGSNNSNYLQFIKINNQIQDLKPKKLDNIISGISIYNDKEKKIFFDVVQPTNRQINQNLHAGTLSFEMSCLDEKIITNCGSIEKRFGHKPRYLRYSAAHSTIILNNTNISELSEKNSYKRIPKKILLNFEEDGNYLNWIASHDGYILNYNKIIKRKLIISKKNNQIMGEDSIISTRYNSNKILYNIRFHLTPICSGVLTNDKKSVFIKTKNKQSWIFKANSNLSFEDSICTIDGKKIEKTKQIVISNYAKNTNSTENWSLTKV